MLHSTHLDFHHEYDYDYDYEYEIWWVYKFLSPGDISLNPTDFGQMSSTTLFLCTCTSSLSARAFSNVDPSFSAIGLTDLQMVPYKKMRIVKTSNNESLTHPLAWLDVLYVEGSFLQCEHHKDRKLSLVLDLKPRTTLFQYLLGFIVQTNLSHHYEC